MSPSTRIAFLAETFPSLKRCHGVICWDAEAIDSWACSGVSHGEKMAVQFVLRVWNHSIEWKCGRFDPIEAYGVWDSDHWNAFQAWVENRFIL